MKPISLPTFLLLGGATVALAMPTYAQAADMQTATPSDPCVAMKAEKAKIREDRKAQETLMSAQIAAMQAAPEQQQVALMAAIIARMEADQIAMETRKDAVEDNMMKLMMPADTASSTAPAPMGCKMMKDMKDMPKDATTAAPMKDMDHPAK